MRFTIPVLFFCLFSVCFAQDDISDSAEPVPVLEEEIVEQPITIPERPDYEKVKPIPLEYESDLTLARTLSVNGAASYFIGFALSYGVATPLSLIAVANRNEGMLLASAAVGLAATGFQIGGPIRNGVGASLAYDYSSHYGVALERNRNWGYYRAGWGLVVASSLLNFVYSFSSSSSSNSNFTLPLIILGLSISADAMWMTSVLNSLSYTKSAMKTSRLSQLHLTPYFNSDGNPGLAISYGF